MNILPIQKGGQRTIEAKLFEILSKIKGNIKIMNKQTDKVSYKADIE